MWSVRNALDGNQDLGSVKDVFDLPDAFDARLLQGAVDRELDGGEKGGWYLVDQGKVEIQLQEEDYVLERDYVAFIPAGMECVLESSDTAAFWEVLVPDDGNHFPSFGPALGEAGEVVSQGNEVIVDTPYSAESSADMAFIDRASPHLAQGDRNEIYLVRTGRQYDNDASLNIGGEEFESRNLNLHSGDIVQIGPGVPRQLVSNTEYPVNIWTLSYMRWDPSTHKELDQDYFENKLD